MASQKRHFPYHSAVPKISFKRRDLGVGNELNSNERVFSGLPEDIRANVRLISTALGSRRARTGQQSKSHLQEPNTSTDFSSWTDQQIQSFLDQRGEDYDAAQSREELVRGAGALRASRSICIAYCKPPAGAARPAVRV